MNPTQMTEAEVSLRLAIHLAISGKAVESVSVAIDGAQVKVRETVHFNVPDFMYAQGWTNADGSARWQGSYTNPNSPIKIEVHSQSGVGDVTTTLKNGQIFLAESKKGPLERSKSSAEYPLLREALGQLLTIDTVPDKAFLAIAVPAGERILQLANRWRKAPLVLRSEIHILTVSPSGEISGW